MQTLLTGFGAFGSVVSNPTERLLKHFADEEVRGHDLTLCLLPVSFACAPQILREAIDKGGSDGRPFDTVLMLGVAARCLHWRVERYGRNYTSSTIPDADGQRAPGRIIAPGAPEALPVSLPVESMLQALKQIGLPAAFSDSAGAYLCNYALFTALQHLQDTGHPAKAGFLHVPADEQTFLTQSDARPVFPFAQHVEAVRAVLDVLGSAS
ncbi:MAG TPA: hypothetical protein VFA07_18215 [Chthonomonadaceae bacterium]|nr:hypothetical protein [Chthonomonadaceae bacterium]